LLSAIETAEKRFEASHEIESSAVRALRAKMATGNVEKLKYRYAQRKKDPRSREIEVPRNPDGSIRVGSDSGRVRLASHQTGTPNHANAYWPNNTIASERQRRDQERKTGAACGGGLIALCGRLRNKSHDYYAHGRKLRLDQPQCSVYVRYILEYQVMGSRSLNKEQAQLVEEHLHLVRGHLRRHVQCPSRPSRSREMDDLYQAGCLGLMEAARLYDGKRGIPFAAFAQRRIHHAVSRTAYEGFSTVKVPMRKQMEQHKQATSAPQAVVHSLEEDPPTRRPDARSDPSGDGTIASRLRQKYVSAVERARQIARAGRSRRGDRSLLVDRVVNDRLLIPDDEHKTSLRQIARETESSYARVADCEKRVLAEIARLLAHDQECRRLRARARDSDHGLATKLDETSTDEQLALRLQDALGVLPAVEAAWTLWRALELTGGDPSVLLARLFARLSTPQKESVCDHLDRRASAAAGT
jgi:RNA polymerase sigma factor (sigma-70 family)